MYDLGVFIGRFQPFHQGHEQVVRRALSQVKKLLILCGSSDQMRSVKNPFLFSERKKFITEILEDCENRLHFIPLKDYPNNDLLWKQCVQKKVLDYADNSHIKSIALVGHRKDESSFYLDFFPEWEMLWVDNFSGISATPIRTYYFENPNDSLLTLPIHKKMRDFLLSFRQKVEYKQLREVFLATEV